MGTVMKYKYSINVSKNIFNGDIECFTNERICYIRRSTGHVRNYNDVSDNLNPIRNYLGNLQFVNSINMLSVINQDVWYEDDFQRR